MTSDPFRRVTLDDVAGLAGVSRATASRALSGKGQVSPPARQAVADAAQALAFTPNHAASTLAGHATEAVALVIPEPGPLVLSDPFIGGTITGLSQAFRQTSFQLLLLISRPGETDQKLGRYLHKGHVDGVIAVSYHGNNDIANLAEVGGVPVVFIGRPLGGIGGAALHYVDVDNRQGGYLACRHLIERGARRIACIAGPSDMSPAADRTDGWHQALRQANLTPGPLVNVSFTADDGAAAMDQMLAVDPAIDGVFAQSDLIAAGAIRAIKASGRQVPRDIAVVGFDDSAVAVTTTPQLTTMSNPADELSSRAAKVLFSLIEGRDVAEDNLIITSHLVVRESA